MTARICAAERRSRRPRPSNRARGSLCARWTDALPERSGRDCHPALRYV